MAPAPAPSPTPTPTPTSTPTHATTLAPTTALPRESFDGNFCFFWHEHEANGYFSNWYPAPFVYRGRAFATSEQYMMWQKAQLFGSFDIADQILRTQDPAACKQLGKQVTGFDSGLWDGVCRWLVRIGLQEKFLQHPDLAARLLRTGGRILAEASPYDAVWGIKTAASDPDAHEVTRWRGKNYLGRTLMELRRELRAADGRPTPAAPMDDYGRVLDTFGDMSLAELRLIPGVRGDVDAYAAIVAFRMSDAYPTPRSFWQAVRTPLATLDGAYCTNIGGGLPAQGYFDMMFDLQRKLELGLV